MKLAKLVILLSCVVHVSVAQDLFSKARASLAAKDTARAIAAFQDALKAGQKPADCNYFLGAIALNQGRTDEAIRFLSAAVKINDEYVDALIGLGDAYILKADAANAVAQYKRAAKVAPKDCRVPASYGAALVELNQLDGPDGAIVQLTKARECDPNNAGVYVSLGDAYYKQGVIPLANQNYEKALELSPNDLQTQLKVARAYVKNRQYTEAIKAFESAVKIDSMNFDAYYEAGWILFRAKQYLRAARFLYRAVNLKPNHIEAASLYLQSLAGAERWTEAAKAGAAAVKLNPASVENWRAYAYALTETREYKGALDAFAALERHKGMKPEDYAYFGKALYNAGEKKRAMDILLKAVEADSTNCDPYFSLGTLYMEQKDYAAAARMFEKRIVCDPKSLTAYVNGGICYMQPPKNLPRARELFLKAIELKPDFFQAQLWLARYYAEVDSIVAMKQTYDDVIRLGSEDPVKNKSALNEAYIQLGSYYFGQKNYAAALDNFRKALTYGESSGLQLAIGQCMILTRGDDADENRKRTEDAISRFRRAIQLDQNSAQAHFWLANSLLYLRIEGDTKRNRELTDEACAEFRKALKLDPKLEDAKKGMERIGCK